MGTRRRTSGQPDSVEPDADETQVAFDGTTGDDQTNNEAPADTGADAPAEIPGTTEASPELSNDPGTESPPPPEPSAPVVGSAMPLPPQNVDVIESASDQEAGPENIQGKPVIGRTDDGKEKPFASEEAARAAGAIPSGFADGQSFVASRPAYLDREERERAAAADTE